jgi:hypothetical protein
VGDRSQGRFATPADFSLHGGSPCTGGYTYDVGVWALSIVQGPFSVAPCQTLALRSATFASLDATDLLPGLASSQGAARGCANRKDPRVHIAQGQRSFSGYQINRGVSHHSLQGTRLVPLLSKPTHLRAVSERRGNRLALDPLAPVIWFVNFPTTVRSPRKPNHCLSLTPFHITFWRPGSVV